MMGDIQEISVLIFVWISGVKYIVIAYPQTQLPQVTKSNSTLEKTDDRLSKF